MKKNIILCALLFGFSSQVFSGLTEDQCHPFANEKALQNEARAQVQKILDERDMNFPEILKTKLRDAVSQGKLPGSVIYAQRISGSEGQVLIDWVDENLPEPVAQNTGGPVDCGRFGTVEKLQAAARRRAGLVLLQLKEENKEDEYGPLLDEAIASGALKGSAIYDFSMGNYISGNPLEVWIKENLL